MIRVLALGFGPDTARQASSAVAALRLLAADRWSPPEAILDIGLRERRWWPLTPVTPSPTMHDAVLLFSECPRDDRALVARFARNAADPSILDAAGYRWAGPAIAPGRAEDFAATFSPFALARAMELAGLPAVATADCDAGVMNKTFYDLLGAGRACALVQLPTSVESARAEGRSAFFNRAEILCGVQAAIGFAAAAAQMRRIMDAGAPEAIAELGRHRL